MIESERHPSQSDTPKVRWYRRNAWVTVMVAGTLFVGPVLALPVLLILCTGPVYSGSDLKRWDLSTKALVIAFALVVMVLWILKVASLLSPTT